MRFLKKWLNKNFNCANKKIHISFHPISHILTKIPRIAIHSVSMGLMSKVGSAMELEFIVLYCISASFLWPFYFLIDQSQSNITISMVSGDNSKEENNISELERVKWFHNEVSGQIKRTYWFDFDDVNIFWELPLRENSNVSVWMNELVHILMILVLSMLSDCQLLLLMFFVLIINLRYTWYGENTNTTKYAKQRVKIYMGSQVVLK